MTPNAGCNQKSSGSYRRCPDRCTRLAMIAVLIPALGASLSMAAVPSGIACGDGRVDIVIDDFDSGWFHCCSSDPSVATPTLTTVPGCHGNALAVDYDLTNPPQGVSWIVLQRFLASPIDLTSYTHIRLALRGSNLNSHDSVEVKLFDGNQLYAIQLPSITDLRSEEHTSELQ